MFTKTLTELSTLLSSKQLSSLELTNLYLERIERHNAKLNAFITVTKELALKQAKAADLAIAQGKHSPLTGIPLAHKDIFCTKDIKTSCGSKMLDNFIPPYDATLVSKLATAGMVCLGKTNMDEFAMGSSNETSYYGKVKNPWQLDKVPGGSSGGATAAIAAGMAPAATGTDTGGSIRQPAAFCGVTGIKPTYGRISRFGMIAFASSLDQAGPIAKSAADCALLLQYMAGWDAKDATSAAIPVPNYAQALNNDIKNLTIGLPEEYFKDGLQPEIQNAITSAINELKKLGVKFKEISLPNVNLSVPTYYVIAPAECSSNLSRYDGVRFGYRYEGAKNLTELYKKSRALGFGMEVKRRILTGTYVLSSGYYDAYYLKALQVRRIISDDFKKAFQEVDVILAPTTPTQPFGFNEKSDPVSMYLSDIYTISANLAGLPAMSLPAGFSNNLPIGMQLIGNYFAEERLLNIAHQYQTVTNWHLQTPNNLE